MVCEAIDLERIVFDPEYRQEMIRRLNAVERNAKAVNDRLVTYRERRSAA